jgi:hypothetical protein
VRGEKIREEEESHWKGAADKDNVYVQKEVV